MARPKRRRTTPPAQGAPSQATARWNRAILAAAVIMLIAVILVIAGIAVVLHTAGPD